MREGWISVGTGGACGAGRNSGDRSNIRATGSAASATSQDQSDQAPPPPPKPKHTKKLSPTAQTNPDLDTDDQLAPSQMNQPVPAAVAQPGAAPPSRRIRPAPPHLRAAQCRCGDFARRIACSGLFAKDSSHLKLAMTFEAKNITFTDVDAERRHQSTGLGAVSERPEAAA